MRTLSRPRPRRCAAALLAAAALAAPLAAAVPAPAQASADERSGDADARGVPPGAAAIVGDEPVSWERYHDYLVLLHGRRPLRDLIDDVLVEQEARRLGLSVSPDELAAEVERFWQSLLVRHRGDATSLAREFETQGHTAEEFRRRYGEERRIALLADRICVATRTVTEEDVRRRFERLYGVDGVRVELRHVYFNEARARRDLARAGAPVAELDEAEVRRVLEERARDVLERLRAGAEFARVAREESHDLSVHQHGGAIPHYNYRRYGPEMAAAVRAAGVGVPTGPVRTAAGLHVIEVTARVVTDLADVRQEIERALATEPASGRELEALEVRLRAETPVRTY